MYPPPNQCFESSFLVLHIFIHDQCAFMSYPLILVVCGQFAIAPDSTYIYVFAYGQGTSLYNVSGSYVYIYTCMNGCVQQVYCFVHLIIFFMADPFCLIRF